MQNKDNSISFQVEIHHYSERDNKLLFNEIYLESTGFFRQMENYYNRLNHNAKNGSSKESASYLKINVK